MGLYVSALLTVIFSMPLLHVYIPLLCPRELFSQLPATAIIRVKSVSLGRTKTIIKASQVGFRCCCQGEKYAVRGLPALRPRYAVVIVSGGASSIDAGRLFGRAKQRYIASS